MSKLLRNISPIGYLDLHLIGRVGESDVPGGDQPGSGCLIPGEEFEVSDEHAGCAPFWRPATPEDIVRHFEQRVVPGEPTGEKDDDGNDVYTDDELQILDLGYGLLAQTANFVEVERKDPLKGLKTIDELKAYAAAQEPPIDLTGATTKADIIAAIRKA